MAASVIRKCIGQKCMDARPRERRIRRRANAPRSQEFVEDGTDSDSQEVQTNAKGHKTVAGKRPRKEYQDVTDHLQKASSSSSSSSEN